MADTPVLEQTENGLALVSGELRLIADFARLKPRLKHHNLGSELLVKAAKPGDMKKQNNAGHFPLLLDATAGLGEDALLLAAAGFQVLLYEKDPVIFALLEDVILRACQDPELREAANRMKAVCGDSVEAMRGLEESPDVIYLDPMFPERTKSAEVKKKFQLIHGLEKPCDNETELLEAALQATPRKIVVKRPLKGPYLAGVKPSYSLEGKKVRYDVLIPN